MTVIAPQSTYAPSDVTVVVSVDKQQICELGATIASIRSSSRSSSPALLLVAPADAGLVDALSTLYPKVPIVTAGQSPTMAEMRDAGAEHSSTPLVAFLDEGAAVSSGWLETLLPHFDDDCVGAAEATVQARWDRGDRPRWFPSELDWALGCSHPAYPGVSIAVRNTFGTGMVVRRDLLLSVGGHCSDQALTAGADGSGMADTDVCLRIRQSSPETRFLHDPGILVHRPIPASRTTWRFLARRCFDEGVSTAKIDRGALSLRGTVSMEKRVLTRVLPLAVARNLADATRGRTGGAGRAAAVVVGMAFTAAGYLKGRLRYV